MPHHLVRHQLITVANGGGQRLRRDQPLTGVKQRMLDRAAQLPQIAGPGIGEQTIEGRRTELAHRLAPLRSKLLANKAWQIGRALPQPRQPELARLQGIEQLATKQPLLHQLLQRGAAGRYDPHLERQYAGRIEALDATGLEQLQQRRLHGGREALHLLQHERAAVGQFELARPLLPRLVGAHQLQRHPLARQRLTVEGNEGPGSPLAAKVDRLRQLGLAHLLLAAQQDRPLALGRLPGVAQQLAHGARFAHQGGEFRHRLAQLVNGPQAVDRVKQGDKADPLRPRQRL